MRPCAAAAAVCSLACQSSAGARSPMRPAASADGRADPDRRRRGRHPQLSPSRSRRASPMSRSTSTSISPPSASAAPRRSTSIAKPGASEIILDDKGLEIASDHRRRRASRSPTRSAPSTPILGAPLTIAMRRRASKIVIRYKSAPDSGALQWLTPEQTAGQEAPLSAQPGPGDREPQLDPDPGFARHPPDVGSAGSACPRR